MHFAKFNSHLWLLFTINCNMIGVSNEVTTTINITAANTSLLKTPNWRPLSAKIKPISPRGTIPKPTIHRLIRLGSAIPETTFPPTAAALKANPNRGVTFYLCSLIDNLALDPKAAIVDLSAALEVQPDYEMALRDRAIRYKEVGDLAHAMQDANLFLATRPGDVKMKALKAELEKVVQK